jgi:uncharacterized iron-regulated membrane protein
VKVRTDIVRMYVDIHGWVGIVCGLALFVAFFAGAITMFETPLQRWATPPGPLPAPVSLERAPELVAKVLAAHPQAARAYDVVVAPGPEDPARVRWSDPLGEDEHAVPVTHYAALASDGSLWVTDRGPSPVAQFVDVLHQQVGLPFEHETAMPIMGAVALLYAVAIVSGVFALLPSLVKDLFALRFGRNVKRMWLDVHNLLGVFSLPFHLVMALTSVVFAFHDQFYDAQERAFGGVYAAPAAAAPPAAAGAGAVLPPAEVVRRLGEQAPGFTVATLTYGRGPGGAPYLRAYGSDPRYGLRSPTFGLVGLDPSTADMVMTDYMPGRQDGWSATVTSFFALHFGSFGGAPIRWAYFLLGLAGAALFYTGNLLWVESRRRRERKAGAAIQTRSTRILAALTVGVPLGCVAGVAVTIAAAKPLAGQATAGLHGLIYYAVFLAFTAWALARGAARSSVELTAAACLALLTVPAASLVAGGAWFPDRSVIGVDVMAVLLAAGLALAIGPTRRRVRTGAIDSVWSAGAAGPRPASP